jgi:hypothetical protein
VKRAVAAFYRFPCAWILAAWRDVVIPYIFIGQYIGSGAFRKIVKLFEELPQNIEECAALGVL